MHLVCISPLYLACISLHLAASNCIFLLRLAFISASSPSLRAFPLQVRRQLQLAFAAREDSLVEVRASPGH